MLLCPIQNNAVFNVKWLQERPIVTQAFGKDFMSHGVWAYKSMGMKGHNGIDFRAAVGTPLFAPMSGEVLIKDDKKKGYGLHVKIRSLNGREVVLGHFSEVDYSKHGKTVYAGDYLGKSGNTGFSTAPHLHFGYRRLNVDNNKNIWQWTVKNYDNGYFGYVDVEKYIITWKGTLTEKNLTP